MIKKTLIVILIGLLVANVWIILMSVGTALQRQEPVLANSKAVTEGSSEKTIDRARTDEDIGQEETAVATKISKSAQVQKCMAIEDLVKKKANEQTEVMASVVENNSWMTASCTKTRAAPASLINNISSAKMMSSDTYYYRV